MGYINGNKVLNFIHTSYLNNNVSGNLNVSGKIFTQNKEVATKQQVADLEQEVSSLGSLKPSGTDTSTNILAFTEDKGIWIATDNGHWYYWNGTQYVDGGVYQATQLRDNDVHKYNLNDDVYQDDGITMNGVTFVSPNNSVSMIIYFEATGTVSISVKGTNLASRNPRLKIGYNLTNTATDPTLISNEIISGEFEKTYTISHNLPYTCIIFEVAVGSYTTFDELLNISNPLITINNKLMSAYSNIVFKNYTPNNYLYLVTGLPYIIDSDYVGNYVNNFYNLNTLPYLKKHNIISVSNAQELVNAINSIATNVSNNIATKNNRYDIYLNSGTYELYDVIDKSNLQDQVLYHRGLEIPDYVNLYGIGSVTLKLTLPDTERATNVQILSTINTYGENYFENLNIEVTNGRYCVHDDDGGDYKNRTISFKNCTFKHNGNIIGYWESQECYGAGYTGGRKGIFTNCKFESANFFPLYMHTSSSWYMTDKCYLELNNCVLLGANNEYSMDIHDAYGTTNTAIVNINNCYLQNKLKIRGTNPFTLYGGGNNDFDIDNNTTTSSKIYIVGNTNSNFN